MYIHLWCDLLKSIRTSKNPIHPTPSLVQPNDVTDDITLSRKTKEMLTPPQTSGLHNASEQMNKQ